MIKIDGLYFLLLIEFLVVFAATSVVLFFRIKKIRGQHQATMHELTDANTALEAMRKQHAAQRAGASPDQAIPKVATAIEPAAAVETKEQEELKTRVTSLEEQLQEKEKLIEALKAKYADLEKEYMVLYQQQQTQQPSI